jgi:hypothetical protein
LSIRACSAVSGTIQQPIRLRLRRQRPRRRAAEQRDELAPFLVTEMHLIPHGPEAHLRISNYSGLVSRLRCTSALPPRKRKSSGALAREKSRRGATLVGQGRLAVSTNLTLRKQDDCRDHRRYAARRAVSPAFHSKSASISRPCLTAWEGSSGSVPNANARALWWRRRRRSAKLIVEATKRGWPRWPVTRLSPQSFDSPQKL